MEKNSIDYNTLFIEKESADETGFNSVHLKISSQNINLFYLKNLLNQFAIVSKG
jgi:hypothetical protein